MSNRTESGTPSVKAKRIYRKGNPLSLAERQQAALARKRETHKEVRIFVRNELKDQLVEMCEARGVTQAELIECLIERETSRT
ncbi:replication regulatory protein RepA [Erwinia aphidicola]|uniref:replication regulatory protein RepA n=1 Tax=Erwinia aphidicola TaxID=68334 RepID=UPI000C1A8733|nr:replication protein [Erwinia sp. OLMDLW33]